MYKKNRGPHPGTRKLYADKLAGAGVGLGSSLAMSAVTNHPLQL